MNPDPLLNAARRYLEAQLYLEGCGAVAGDGRLQENLEQTRRRLEEAVAAAERREHRVRSPIFQRILVAVDSSPAASAGIATASELAADVSAALAVVHVVDTLGSVSARALTNNTPIRDEMLRRGDAQLKRLATLLSTGVQPDLMLREGAHADEIIKAADAWRADLIVMGSRGLGRLGRFLLGSTTEAVIQQARQPVLVVTHEALTALQTMSRAQAGSAS